MPLGRKEARRILFAAVIAPALPLAICSSIYWYNNGSSKWFIFFFLFGYIYFALVGVPAIGFLLKRRRFSSCLLTGGLVSIAPVLFVDSLTLFSRDHVFTFQYLLTLVVLFFLGCLGGSIFWYIAFFGGMSKKLS